MIKNISSLTGIKEEIINKEGIKPLLTRPKSIQGITKLQIKKLESLSEFIRLYNSAEFLNEKQILGSSSAAQEYCKKIFENITDKEYFYIIFLNTQNEVISTKKLFEGTLNESAIYPREIIKACLEHNTNTVIISHNHPSGSLQASNADLQTTKKINEALKTIDIKLLDHIIVTPDRACISFAEKGLI